MSQTTAAIGADVRRWAIDPAHTEVEFSVRHMMISTVKGSFPGVEGIIELPGEDGAGASVDVTIDAASITTGNQDRDAHLRGEDFFHVEKWPSLRFRSRSVERKGDGFRVVGDLTIRDVTREVAFDAEELGRGIDPWGNPRVAFRAETRINRKDYGLTWNQALEAGGVLVGDEVRIHLEVQAIPARENGNG